MGLSGVLSTRSPAAGFRARKRQLRRVTHKSGGHSGCASCAPFAEATSWSLCSRYPNSSSRSLSAVRHPLAPKERSVMSKSK